MAATRGFGFLLGSQKVLPEPPSVKFAHCLTKNLSEIASLPHVRNLSEVPPAQAEGGADREAEYERATGGDPGAGAALSQSEEEGEGGLWMRW